MCNNVDIALSAFTLQPAFVPSYLEHNMHAWKPLWGIIFVTLLINALSSVNKLYIPFNYVCIKLDSLCITLLNRLRTYPYERRYEGSTKVPSYVFILLKHMVMLSECYQYVLWIINFYQNYQYVLSILRHIHVFVLFHSWVSVWVHFKTEFIGYDLQTCHTYLVS